MKMAKISIALVTLNGADTLPDLLDAIDHQEIDERPEVIAVDSGSNDGTTDLLRTRVDRLLEIPTTAFNHGLTRNFAIEQCSGELVVLIVQDACPADPAWLKNLCAPFAQDSKVAGTFARQLPHRWTTRLTRHALKKWVGSQAEPRRIAFAGPAEWAGLSPEDFFLASVFDNVCSCVRRSAWRDQPFEELPIAEDLAWGKAVLERGWALQYVPEAAVRHAHDRSIAYEFRRTRLVHHELGRLFGLRTIPTAAALLYSLPVTLRNHLDCLRHEEGPRPSPGEILRALGLAFAWPLAQYLSGRDTN